MKILSKQDWTQPGTRFYKFFFKQTGQDTARNKTGLSQETINFGTEISGNKIEILHRNTLTTQEFSSGKKNCTQPGNLRLGILIVLEVKL